MKLYYVKNNYYIITYHVGEIHSEITEEGLLLLKWKDKRIVNMLTTTRNDDIIEKRRRTRKADGGIEVIQKPSIIDDYNIHMGGVGRSDQLVTYYGYPHRQV